MGRSSSRLSDRNRRLIIAGQGISYLGDYLAFFLALPVFVRDETGSAGSLGLLAASETAAVFLFGLLAGVLLDRVRLRRTVVLADIARAFAFGLIALAVVVEVDAVWMAFAVAFVVGSMGTVFDSGLQSLMPSVVEDVDLPGTNGGVEASRNFAMTIGFLVGGLLLAWGDGLAVAFAFDGATYIVSAVAVLFLREIRPRTHLPAGRAGESLREGLQVLWRNRRLRWATAAAVVINFAFAPLAAVLTLFAEIDLGIVDDRLLGVFFAAFSGIAAVIGLFAGRVIRWLGTGRSLVAGGLLFGVGAVSAGFAPGWFAILPLGAATGGVALNQAAFVTLRQRITPEAFLGRVIAASRTIAWVGIPIGASLGGVLGDAIGLRPLFIAGGSLIIVTSVLLATGPLGPRPQDERLRSSSASRTASTSPTDV